MEKKNKGPQTTIGLETLSHKNREGNIVIGETDQTGNKQKTDKEREQCSLKLAWWRLMCSSTNSNDGS